MPLRPMTGPASDMAKSLRISCPKSDEPMGQFLARLRDIWRNGLAYDTDEHSKGISAIGTAFQDRSGTCYAISVPVPSTRFSEVRDKVEKSLLRARKNVTDVFGIAVM